MTAIGHRSRQRSACGDRCPIAVMTCLEGSHVHEADETRECWFLTGSQALYGDETLRQVAQQSAEIVALLNAGPEIGVRLIWKPVLTGAAEIRRACIEASSTDQCIGVIAWMHTFSPAKAWIAGLDRSEEHTSELQSLR